MSGCGRRYHLITGQVETVCQNRCPVLTDAIRIRQCSDLLCEVEPSEVATSCYRYRIYVNAPFGSFFVINVSHFYRREGWENGKSGETARTSASSFVRVVAVLRPVLIINLVVAIISTKIPILLVHGFWGFNLRQLPYYGFWA